MLGLRHASGSKAQIRATERGANGSGGSLRFAARLNTCVAAHAIATHQQSTLDTSSSATGQNGGVGGVEPRVQFKALRDNVVQNHLAGGLLYLYGGNLITRNGGDVYYKYRPESNFMYMTGVTEPGCACVVDSETGTARRFWLIL